MCAPLLFAVGTHAMRCRCSAGKVHTRAGWLAGRPHLHKALLVIPFFELWQPLQLARHKFGHEFCNFMTSVACRAVGRRPRSSALCRRRARAGLRSGRPGSSSIKLQRCAAHAPARRRPAVAGAQQHGAPQRLNPGRPCARAGRPARGRPAPGARSATRLVRRLKQTLSPRLVHPPCCSRPPPQPPTVQHPKQVGPRAAHGLSYMGVLHAFPPPCNPGRQVSLPLSGMRAWPRGARPAPPARLQRLSPGSLLQTLGARAARRARSTLLRTDSVGHGPAGPGHRVLVRDGAAEVLRHRGIGVSVAGVGCGRVAMTRAPTCPIAGRRLLRSLEGAFVASGDASAAGNWGRRAR